MLDLDTGSCELPSVGARNQTWVFGKSSALYVQPTLFIFSFIFEAGLSVNKELPVLTRLAGQQAPGVFLTLPSSALE